MGLFSAIAGIFGGGAQKKASRRAEEAERLANARGLETIANQIGQTRELYRPATDQLAPTMQALAAMLGLNGQDAQRLSIDGLQDSPEMAAYLRAGEEGLLAEGSATGELRGGNIRDAMMRFRGDTLARMIGEQYNRLGGMAGLSLGGVNSVSGFGAQAAENTAGLQTRDGQIRANGLLTRGGINAGIWNNIGGSLDQMASKIPGIGSFFG
jgi:hypothetical protein